MDIFYPIQLFADWLTYGVFNLRQESLAGSALDFFIYDCIKILILLLVIMFLVSLVRTFLTPEKIRKALAGKHELVGNVTASSIGIVTPFCTCSAIPLFIGFVESGVPLGTTFSYLIAAPMINEVAAILLFGLFGWEIALIYIVSGFVIAVVAGYILGRMKLEHLVEDFVWKTKVGQTKEGEERKWKDRIDEAAQETKSIILKIYPYVLIGIGIGAIIHGYAPENLLAQIAGKGNLLAVPIAVLIGVPLYSNAAGIFPVIQSLINKGLPVGTALAFMMSVTALSLPEMIILKKVLKPKLLAIYITIITVGIIFTGYLFNLIM